MPLREYKCLKCGLTFEILVRSFSQKEVSCPGCGSRRLQKLISRFYPDIFKPYWHHNLDVEPVYIESRKQEKEEFEKRGLIDAR